MDAHAELLAERVAEAADAWLRDPQDVQVYGRLVAATIAWRRGSAREPAGQGSVLPEAAVERVALADDGAGEPAGGEADETAHTVTLPPRVGDALGEFVAGLQRRQAAAEPPRPEP